MLGDIQEIGFCRDIWFDSWVDLRKILLQCRESDDPEETWKKNVSPPWWAKYENGGKNDRKKNSDVGN